jgi:hypothetical protein
MSPRFQFDGELELLRRSVTRQDFAAVEQAARRCSQILESNLADLSPAEAESRLHDLLRGMEAARRAVLVSRVRLAEQLAGLRPRASYGHDSRTVHTFRIDL